VAVPDGLSCCFCITNYLRRESTDGGKGGATGSFGLGVRIPVSVFPGFLIYSYFLICLYLLLTSLGFVYRISPRALVVLLFLIPSTNPLIHEQSDTMVMWALSYAYDK
jgi:hypothetical protein